MGVFHVFKIMHMLLNLATHRNYFCEIKETRYFEKTIPYD